MKTLKIVGIEVKTSNQEGKAAIDIPQLWSKFFTEQIFDKIENKTSNDIYAVYTDYESDFTGSYTTIIGAKVNNFDNVPKNLVKREFELQDFKKYTAKGNMPEAIVNTWNKIWAEDKELNRSYTFDFEVYGTKCQNGENSEVEIFISIKN